MRSDVMARVRLIHWNADEAKARARALRSRGLRVDWEPFERGVLTKIAADPPDAFVIDLERAPSQGRDLAVHLRRRRSTRAVPLIFVGGEESKVERVRELLPDASYVTWRGVTGAVKRALARAAADPIVPESEFAAYSGRPLAAKLGVKNDTVVALVCAPDGFRDTLGTVPSGVTVRDGARGKCDLAIWFVRSKRELDRRIARMGEYAGSDGLWIAWPKRSSGVASDLTQIVVRRTGLASGLVDYKVCSIDATWSGLKFARREAKRTRRRRSG
jgi:hypothetical protein